MSSFFRFFTLSFLLFAITGVSFAQVNDNEILQNPVTSNTTVYAIKTITLKPGFHVPQGVSFTAKVLSDGYFEYTGTDTDIKNWTESKAFDENGNVIAHGKSYFDLTGKPVQSQTENLSTGKTIVSQTVYDAFGRAVISTLPAAISNTDLAYKKGFVADLQGGDYSYEDFDGAKLTSPDQVNQALPNTLGWYYSNNNTMEAYVPASAYPYTRVEYSKITGQQRRSAMAGEFHRMGNTNHTEPMSFTMPASDTELSSFASNLGPNFEYKGLVKTVGVDAMGKESIVYSNSDGNIVASCISGGSLKRTILINIIELWSRPVDYIDIHIAKGCENSLSVPTASTIYNLLTDEKVGDYPQGNVSIPAGYYRIKYINAGEILTSDPRNLSYKINYTNYAFNIYNKVGRLVESYSPKAVEEVMLNGNHNYRTTYTYNILGWLIETVSPDEGKTQYVYRKDGSIRFSQNAQQYKAPECGLPGFPPPVNYSVFSYTNYDESGRIIEVGEYKSADITFDINMNPETILLPENCISCTYTKYDIPASLLPIDKYKQNFVVGNVSETGNDNTKTWYSYTYDGKVEWVMQDIVGLGVVTIDYEYDFNGNVTHVIYEKNNINERFEHEYKYDADLRLTEVRTYDMSGSCPKSGWLQAKYFYYAHGPLKRVEIANNLQGIDYVYNINGWLKSINDPSLLSTNDPGNDDTDLFGMALDYYSGDYTRAGTNISSISEANLYDGNIKAQRWQIRTTDAGMNPGANNTWLSTYTYNNLNYLQSASFGKSNYNAVIQNQIPVVNGLDYDANGNLKFLNRYNTEGTAFDQFTYNYNNTGKPNQLSTLVDAAANLSYGDIKAGNHSFAYNNIGQMTEHNDAGTNEYYKYDVYGKVTAIYTDAAMVNPVVEYTYNDKGYRVKKTDYSLNTETWYVTDVSGNILSIYTADNGGAITQTEIPVYGSGRIGTNYKTDNQFVYELSDHLGNVRATFGKDASGNLQLYSYADYYPFGMKIPGRSKTASTKYRFGYQGQFAEEDPETEYNAFELRLWDSQIGRWMSPDPYGQYHSPYLGMGNNPINGVDPDGGKWTDWFKNSETGSLVWKDVSDKTIMIDGLVYENIGKNMWFFSSIDKGILTFYKGENPIKIFSFYDLSTTTRNSIDGLSNLIKNNATRFMLKALSEGKNLQMYMGNRTIKEQNDLYSIGRDKNGNIIDKSKVVTYAKGGESYHNYGLAFDVVEVKNGVALWNNSNWNNIGSMGKKYGFEWGGGWTKLKDKPHFQNTFGKTTSQLQLIK